MKKLVLVLFSLMPCFAMAGEIADNSVVIIKSINEYYIEKTSSAKIGLDLISGLQKIDSNIKIWKQKTKISVSYNGIMINSYPYPRNNGEWSKLFESVVKKLQYHSYILSKMNEGEILKMATDDVLAKLDAYSYYNPAKKVHPFTANAKPSQIIITKESYGRYISYRKENQGILTIEIKKFDENSVFQVKKAIEKFSLASKVGIKGIIIDLRDNKGGSLQEAVKVADLFLDREIITSVKGRNEDSFQNYYAKDGQIAKKIPMIVVVNSQTASSAEMLAGALQENKRAKVVGENSYGKSSVQTGVMLPNDSEIVLTWANFLTPNGKDIDGIGIVPDKKIQLKQYDSLISGNMN